MSAERVALRAALQAGGLTVIEIPPDLSAPLTSEQRANLAQQVPAGHSLAEIIVEEREEGP